MTLKKRRVLLLISVVIFIIAAPVINLYLSGYRFTSDFKLTKTGGIYVHSPESSAKVFLNNEFQKETGLIQSGVFMQNLKPGNYTVLVAKDGFWPWQKTINVREEHVSEIRAILISKEPEGKVLTKGNFLNMSVSPYQKIIAITEKNSKGNTNKLSFYIPDKNAFLNPTNIINSEILNFTKISNFKWEENGITLQIEPKNALIKIIFNLNNETYSSEKINSENFSFVNSNLELSVFYANETKKLINFNTAKITNGQREIIWIGNGGKTVFYNFSPKEKELPYFIYNEKNIEMPLKIFNSKYPIENIDFFPERRDAIIIAVNNGVYAMDLDGRGKRMMQPIYKGKKPTFGIFKNEDTVYILDDGNLSEVKIN